MPSVQVNIQPTIIKWALSQTDAAKLDKKMSDNISKWLDGTKAPTFNQIEEFSRKSNIPLGYFFLMEPPVEHINLLEYRTIDSIELSNPSRNLIDTIYEMENVQDWMREYRQDTGYDVLKFVGSLKGQTDILSVASSIHDDLGLGLNWYEDVCDTREAFNHVRRLLEECGVIVMLNGIVGANTHRTLNIDEFRAFAMIDEWAPLIFINNNDSKGAMVFSLFHEIAHIWLGTDDFYNDRRGSQSVEPLETICNDVAAELIVPTEIFLELWSRSNISDIYEKISSLARIFKCSESVIARKALDNDKIDWGTYNAVVDKSIKAYIEYKQKSDAPGGDYYNNMGARLDTCFVKALIESVQTGRTTYTEAYRLTNTKRSSFDGIVKRMGGAL